MPAKHHCSWKDQYLGLAAEIRQLKAEMQSREASQLRPETSDVGVGDDDADEGLGVEGLTIVVHLKGRDDLVINTDLRNVS